MRHIFLGIAAIAAVQIAFQLLVVDDYAPEYAASVAPGAWRPDPIVTVRGDIAPTIEAPDTLITRAKHRKTLQRRPVSVRASYRRVVPRAPLTLTASKTPPRKRQERFDGPVHDDDKGDGKPWIAKALPIVKKPYSWLKALGAKLK